MVITENVKEYFHKTDIIFVGTADDNGKPHLAAGEEMVFTGSNTVRIEAWFCTETIKNLHVNPNISIAVIDRNTKKGYQLTGIVEKIQDRVMMDGYQPEQEEKWAGFPTTQYALSINIKEVLEFTTGVHSDKPLPCLK